MDLTPQLLHEAEFREARRGGYDTRDVDEFLERIAVGVQSLHDRLRQALERAEAAEARLASPQAAPARSAESEDLDETLKRTLVLAQRTADAAIREAEELAAQTVATARDEADRLSSEARQISDQLRQSAEEEARRGADEARHRAIAEVTELNSSRDVLRRDVDALTLHIDQQRRRLRLAADSLQRLLDDPAVLREAPVPELHEVEVPEPPVEEPDEVLAADDDELLDDDDGWSSVERPLRADDTAPAERPEPERPLRAPEHVDPLAERDPGDEDYLAELRKAMTDESPLGPREEGDDEEDTGLFDIGRSRRERSRFGRRS
jgi:cell division initiation protein